VPDHDDIERLLPGLFDGDCDATAQALLKIGEPALHRLLQLPMFGGSEDIRWAGREPRWDQVDFRDRTSNLMGALAAIAEEHMDAFLAAIREADRVHNWIIISILADMKLKSPEVVDIFLEAMKGRESLLREYAVKGLWRTRSRRAVEPLIKALSDRAPDVRYVAVQAICGLGDERALGPLRKMHAAKSNANRRGIREYAAKAIAKIEARQRARRSSRKSGREESPNGPASGHGRPSDRRRTRVRGDTG
jgi:HEAT repeat protein